MQENNVIKKFSKNIIDIDYVQTITVGRSKP